MTSIPYDNGRYSSHLNYSGSFDLYSTTAELGITTSDGNNASTSERSDFDASPYKRVNLGMCVGVAYEYMGISLSVAYQYMFTNLADKGFWDGDRWTVFGNASQLMPGYSQRNNLLQITVGYTFRY